MGKYMLKRIAKIIFIIVGLSVVYEIVAFSTHLLKPLIVAPFTLIGENPSSSQLLWYQNIHYLIARPKQMDMVLFQDQTGNRRVGVIETIILTESKNDRTYRIRLFLKSDGDYFITVHESSIVGEIFPSNKLISQMKFNNYGTRLVASSSIAPILQKIQKTTFNTSTPFMWNKPQVNGMQYPFFSARNNNGYTIQIQNIPFIEFATTTDLSKNSTSIQQIKQSLDQVIVNDKFSLANEPSTDPDRQSFQFTSSEYVCSGTVYIASQAMLPYDDPAETVNLTSHYWSLKLACVTRKQFEDADQLSKPFREDFGANINSFIYVNKISGDYALLFYRDLTIAHKINGHWKIILSTNGMLGCPELESLHIPADISEGLCR